MQVVGKSTSEVSIVVLATAAAGQLRRCLAAIEAHAAVEHELVVVLGAATGEVREIVAAAPVDRVVDVGVNCGTAVGWNLGFDAARAPRVLILHEDAYLTAGALPRLLEAAGEHPRSGVVCARTLQPDTGAVDSYGGGLWRSGEIAALRDPMVGHLPEKPFAVTVISGCASLVQRSAWEEVGGFDERHFPFTYVDVDFCLALRARGYQPLVVPRAEAVHETQASLSATGALAGVRFRHWMHARQRARVVAKWGEIVRAMPEQPAEPTPADLLAALPHGDPLPIPDPPGQSRALSVGPGGMDGVRDRLVAAEHAILSAFAADLADENADLGREIDALRDALEQAGAEAAQLRARSEAYLRIVSGRTWRLRNGVLRATRQRSRI